MSGAKHTKGPWIVYADTPSVDPNWHIITTANRMRVIANVHIEPGNAVDAANARLLVAAPDLLAQVEKCGEFIAREIEKASKAGHANKAYILGLVQFDINATLMKVRETPAEGAQP